MGMSYSAVVFYGTFVPRRSALWERLDAIIDAHGGTPAPAAGHPGVELDYIGSWPTGEVWIVIQAKGSAKSYGREDETEAPVELVEAIGWHAALLTFKATLLGGDALPTIGWYFGGLVM